MYDVAIIGSGIVGAALFRELGRYQLKTALLEKENDVGLGASRANSAIVHAGYDPPNGTKMAKYNVQGNRLFDQLCSELSVPFKRNGSLILALTEEERSQLPVLLDNGIRNGVPSLELLSPEQTKVMEPHLTDQVLGALYAPTGGIVGAYELTIALAENSLVNGGHILLESEVVGIKWKQPCIQGSCSTHDYFEIQLENGSLLQTRRLVNAAGIYADKIHQMLEPSHYTIRPRKGEYFLLDRTEGEHVTNTIFRAPSRFGKGVLVAPTVHGNLLVGPNAVDLDDRSDTATTAAGLSAVRQGALMLCPGINFQNNIRNFAGLRAQPDGRDFIIERSESIPGFIELAGIKSPGLTAAPAIALAAVEMLADSGLELIEKNNFNPARTQTHFIALSPEKKRELIIKEPSFGRIICRCENITEGEIIESIHRPLGAQTVDGVKRRVRPGCGRCQGGFCFPKVVAILARELQGKEKDLNQDRTNSWILIGPSK